MDDRDMIDELIEAHEEQELLKQYLKYNMAQIYGSVIQSECEYYQKGGDTNE